ncbi:MAG: Serine/threonine protein kinase, partial [Verrucomicrobiaceae bacterium]|nr:Serine/threonine protein kinase [Verrucomicrobiaceae bacterium]
GVAARATPPPRIAETAPTPPPKPPAKVSMPMVVGSLVTLIVAGGFVVMMSMGKSGEPKPSPELKNEALAAQTRYFNEQQTHAEEFENEALPVRDKLKRWSDLLAEVRGSDFQTEPAVRKIMLRAEDRMDHLKDEGRKAQMAYTVNVSDLKRASEDATKLSEQKDKGAAAKADKWNEVVTKFVPAFALVDEATDHVALLDEAKRQVALWQAKAESETPKTLPPETLVFMSGPAGGWADYGKKELLKLVQSALAFKGSIGVKASGIWDNATFQGLKGWQKEKSLPTTGVLDAITVEALGLQGMPEPKQTAAPLVVQNKPQASSGGESTRHTSSRQAPEASSSSSETNPWAKSVQQRISGGGGFAPPMMPFGPR